MKKELPQNQQTMKSTTFKDYCVLLTDWYVVKEKREIDGNGIGIGNRNRIGNRIRNRNRKGNRRTRDVISNMIFEIFIF